MDEREKRDRIEGALEEALEEGDAFAVRCGSEGITVEPITAVEFQRAHADLYGFLRAVNDRMRPGCTVPVAFLTAGVAGCFALHRWLPDWTSWWLYVLVLLVAGTLWGLFETIRERALYARHRREVADAVARAGLTRAQVLGELLGDTRVALLMGRLARDPDATG